MPGRGRGRKDSASDNGTEEQPVVGTFETLRDEGEHFVHVKQFQRAIESFSKALEMKPGDKTCLVTRAKCHLMLGNSAAALIDAEKALADEEESKGKDIRALCMKAEALYQKGDFEAALVFYHRGNKLRPELQEFRLGIQKCQEAINNSIGTPDSVKLDASGDLSFFYKQDEDKMKQKKAQAKGGTYSKPSQQKKEERKERKKPQDVGSSKTTKQLLGELYCDRTFLEKLYDSLVQRDTDPADRYIKDQTVDGLEYLSRRADFWRQHKPMYARERDRKRQRQQWSAKSRAGDDLTNYILKRLEEIDDAQAKGKYELSLSKAEKTLKKMEGWGEDRVKNKPSLVANLYSCMGNAHLELDNYEEAVDYHTKDLDIGEQHDLEEARSRALDNLGRTNARMGQFEEAIIIWEKKLPKSKTKLESTWLYHEIGRCHLELGHYSEAKDFGEKSLAAAKETDDLGWQLHASVLVAQAEVKCDELQAAVDSFERALEIAEKTNDSSAQSAIKKALEEVNARIVQGVQDGDEKDKDAGDAEGKEIDSRGKHKGHGQIEDGADGQGGDRGKHRGQNRGSEADGKGQFEDAEGSKGKSQDKGRDEQEKEKKIQIKDKDNQHEDQGKHKGQNKDKNEEDKPHGPNKDKEDHHDQGRHLGQTNNASSDKETKADSKKEEKDTLAVSS